MLKIILIHQLQLLQISSNLFRTLIEDNLPLNEGALKDIEIRFSENSMLNPKHPSPVVAGNVETSQTLIDVLNGALEIQAGLL